MFPMEQRKILYGTDKIKSFLKKSDTLVIFREDYLINSDD